MEVRNCKVICQDCGKEINILEGFTYSGVMCAECNKKNKGIFHKKEVKR